MQDHTDTAHPREASEAWSVPGPRERNEDAWIVDDELGAFVLADGMGGYSAGDVAAAIAVDAARSYLGDAVGRGGVDPDQALALVEEAVQIANAEVLVARKGPHMHRPMGTTLVVALLASDGVAIAHAGDSRAYLVRRGRGVRLTRDHNVLEDPPYGSWSSRIEDPEGLRHLTRCIGFRPVVSSEARASSRSFPATGSCCAATGSGSTSTRTISRSPGSGRRCRCWDGGSRSVG